MTCITKTKQSIPVITATIALLASQPASQPASQTDSQPASQPDSQPASQTDRCDDLHHQNKTKHSRDHSYNRCKVHVILEIFPTATTNTHQCLDKLS